jgi:hypothetical protein
MAIIFDKDISEQKLLMAYNNNIIRFHYDSLGTVLTASSAEIIENGINPDKINVKIYPSPDGKFFFNFKEHITSRINTKNFEDNNDYTGLDFNNSPFNNYFDVSDGCYLENDFIFKINLSDGTNIFVQKHLHFLAWAENQKLLSDVFYNNAYDVNSIVLLSPTINKIKMFEGYPFDFSFFAKESTGAAKIRNLVNNDLYDIYIATAISTNKSVFNINLLQYNSIGGSQIATYGRNDYFMLEISTNYGADKTLIFNLQMVPYKCGVYIKFLNKYGRWNYWLFDKNYFETQTTKNLGEINNDFNNLNDTISPTLQIGKMTDINIKCITKKLDEYDKIILDGLIDSPKILMYTGDPTINTINSWIGVRLKTTNFIAHDPKKSLYTYYVEFDLPNKNTITN